MAKLRPQIEHFVRLYLREPNGAKAYRESHPTCKSDNAAAVQAGRLLRKPHVQKVLERERARRAMRYDRTDDEIKNEIDAIAFAEPSKTVPLKEKLKALQLASQIKGILKNHNVHEDPDGKPLAFTLKLDTPSTDAT